MRVMMLLQWVVNMLQWMVNLLQIVVNLLHRLAEHCLERWLVLLRLVLMMLVLAVIHGVFAVGWLVQSA